ncbi:hypothetical protein GH714_039926 [Hevea brasiliensis]|uniref:Bet v I/Major latex protein domain-containing protein n=1 Tax=Hevea brasiliensis TaxID=3981 RepID=A0A6A6M3N6_HEVBR|nr:hypothetical protein GH714_039926 [Hevea brasiliensis]
MGVILYEGQVASKVPPAKLFKKFVLESLTLLPKVLPQALESVVNLQGDGGPGTIRQVHFSNGSFVKETVDAIDKENFIFDYSVIEGDRSFMSKELEKICFQIKIEASPDGGSICKRSSKSYAREGVDVNEEEIKAAQEKIMEAFVGIFKNGLSINQSSCSPTCSFLCFLFLLFSRIMGVAAYDLEVTSPVPPAKLFKAFVLDNDDLIQKVIPQAISNVEILEGDGGPGTVRKVTFGEGKYITERTRRYIFYPPICVTIVNICMPVTNLNNPSFAGSQFKYVKHRIEEIDKENLIYRYSVIEGDALMNVLEKISNEIKFEASADGGSICKNNSTYFTIGDFELKQEQIKAGKEKSLEIFKAVEAYLLENPDTYN